MLEDQLQDLGFKYNESKVYLKLLSIGPQPASILAQKSGLNRTTTYLVLKNLQQKGIIASHHKNKMQIYSANDPNSLVAYIDQKCRTYNYQRTQIVNSIPKFRSLVQEYKFHKPIIGYHHGNSGIINMLSLIENNKTPIYAYHNPQKWDLLNFNSPFEIYKKYFHKVYIIIPEPTEQLTNSHKIKYIHYNPSQYPQLGTQEVIILKNQVITINLDPENTFATSTESQSIADFQRTIFKIIWEKFQKSPIL